MPTEEKPHNRERLLRLKIPNFIQWGQVGLADFLYYFSVEGVQPAQLDAGLHPFVDNQHREEVVMGNRFDDVDSIAEVGTGLGVGYRVKVLVDSG
jgi:hypothetical protein